VYNLSVFRVSNVKSAGWLSLIVESIQRMMTKVQSRMKYLLDDIGTLSIPRDVLTSPTKSSETVLPRMAQRL
jgi:hypothetical protein